MADESVILNPGAGGAAIAVDTIAGISHELVKVEFGSDGTATQVDAANPLPVTDAIAEAALVSIAAEDFATSVKQDTGNTSLASIDGKLTNPLPVSISGSVTTGGLTDTQLRATPVPISGTVSTGLTQPLTDVQLRATPVPISGTISTGLTQPLTDAQLRAVPVPISGSVSVTGGAVDNTILYNNTLNAVGAISGLDTTGYESASIQISGVWSGSLIIEGCNDNVLFIPLLVFSVADFSILDSVKVDGNYILKSNTKYIRINVIQISGSVTTLVLGKTSSGINTSDFLAMAMDRGNNTPLYIEETASKKDITNALIPSDAPKPIHANANAISTLALIDTIGYQSIAIQIYGTFVGTVSFQSSNDATTWAAVSAFNTSGSASSSAATAGGVFVAATTCRYFRIQVTAYTSGLIQTVSYLRQQPVQNPVLINSNISQINGTTPLTGGQAGYFVVGGLTAPGVAINGNIYPIVTGAVDSTSAVRRLLSDTSGRLITNINTALTDQSGTARSLGGISPSGNPYNVASIAVTDVTSNEGQNIPELLSQLLLEMRIMNQYMYELPVTLQRQLNDTTKSVGSFGNEPSEYRNDITMFAV